MKKYTFYTIALFLVFVVSIVLWILAVRYISPTSVVSVLGTKNGYLVGFIAAFLASLYPFASLHAIVIATLAAGGLNPIYLGIVAGVAVTLGDMISYVIGRYATAAFPERLMHFNPKFERWLKRQPAWLAFVTIFLFACAVPFSNVAVVITLGLAKYPFWRSMIALGLGNFVFNIFIAFVGLYGWTLLG